MTEIASPASDPRFLRRHYPHQVQRVRLNDVSAKRLPRIFFLGQNKTQRWEINSYIRCAFRHNRGIGEPMPAAKLPTINYPPAGACFTFV